MWYKQDLDYEIVLDHIRATIGPYIPILTEEEAAQEILETIMEILFCKVEFSEDNPDGTLHWPDVERMLTSPNTDD